MLKIYLERFDIVEGPVLMKIVHESTGINVEESGNLPAPRKRGRPPKYKTAGTVWRRRYL